MISSIRDDGSEGLSEISPHIYQKRLALNIILMFCYSERFDDIKDPLFLAILEDASIISRSVAIPTLCDCMTLKEYSSFRSTNSNAQDYIPYLRYFKNRDRTQLATVVRSRRDTWLAALLQRVRDSASVGKAKKCVAESLLANDNEAMDKCES